MVHAQTVREDQLDRMRALGIIPSFFSTHCFYWGDWYVGSVLGRERAYRISPARSAQRRGMRFSLHNDAPVVPPNILFLIWNAVTRLSRGGEVIGPEQRMTPAEALRAVTLDAAYQHFEEATKGSIEVGKLADMVVLSDNPLRVAPEAIKDIVVLATLKEGVPVHLLERARLPEALATAATASRRHITRDRRGAVGIGRRGRLRVRALPTPALWVARARSTAHPAAGDIGRAAEVVA